MPTYRNSKRARGMVHDVATLLAYGEQGCNVVFLSDSSLYILNNLAELDATFLTRYATGWAGESLYTPLTSTDTDAEAVVDRILTLQQELIPMNCDITAALDCICNAINGLALVGSVPASATGATLEPLGTTGDPGSVAPPGYGETPNDILQHCQMANYYYRQLKSTFQAFLDYNVLGLLSLGVAIAASQILALLGAALSTAFFGLLVEQIGAFTALLGLLLGSPEDDLQEVLDALNADEAGFVCALYLATNVTNAKNNITDWATNQALGSGQISLMLTVLNNYVLSGLFFPSDAALAEVNEYTGLYDCDNCIPEGVVFWTNPQSPYNTILVGEYTPQWVGDPDDDITESASGWCTQTIRSLGSYRRGLFYMPNPNYLGGAPIAYRVRLDFTIRNTALESPIWFSGTGLTKTSIVRGPGYSSGAFRASTAGLTDLDSWEEANITVPTTEDYLRFGSLFFYDSNYNNSLPGCLRKMMVTLTPL